MLRVRRSKDNPLELWIVVEPGFPLESTETIWMKRACASVIECQMLCELLQRKIDENMAEVRKASYFRGWKHAKAKKSGRRIWFPTAVSLLPWEKEEAGL